MAWRLSTSPVREIARAKGIKNMRQLKLLTGLNFRTIEKYWKDIPGEIQQYDSDVLLTLCIALECQPGDLIIKVPE